MKEIKMSLKKKNGKTIEKGVPENLASLYEKQGWKIVETKKQEPKSSFSNKANDIEE